MTKGLIANSSSHQLLWIYGRAMLETIEVREKQQTAVAEWISHSAVQ